MLLFSVQKEMQRGVLTALPAGGSPVEITTFKCFFFPLEGEVCKYKRRNKCWCLLLDHHIDLYQSGSQTCSYA